MTEFEGILGLYNNHRGLEEIVGSVCGKKDIEPYITQMVKDRKHVNFGTVYIPELKRAHKAVSYYSLDDDISKSLSANGAKKE